MVFKLPDLDEIFAYKTIKVVKMLDRRLGFLFYTIQVLVLIYILVFVFAMNQGYLASEISIGQVSVRVIGATYSKVNGLNVPYDAIDMRQPSIENGAVFIATKIDMIRQERGTCVNPEYPCAINGDCPAIVGVSEQICTNGQCMMHGWCPGIDPSNDNAVTVRLEHPEDVILWFRSSISFPTLSANATFSTMNHEDPVFSEAHGATDAWTLKELINLADGPLGAIKEDGALMSVRLEWTCRTDTGDGCDAPIPHISRLDEGKVRGFSYHTAHYIREPSLDMSRDKRVLMEMTGVRILVASKGTGKQVSLMATVLQISSGLALLSVAKLATDIMMLQVLPEKEHYRKYKEELTPDFSDLRDKVVEKENQKAKLRGSQSRYRVVADDSMQDGTAPTTTPAAANTAKAPPPAKK